MTTTNENSALVAAALVATDPGLAASIDATNTWQADLLEQGARVDLYRKYEEGEHRSGITDQMRRMLRLPEDETGITDFNDNYCQIIVSKMVGRLEVTEITTGDANIDKTWLIPTLERNKWAARQGSVFEGAVRDGESFIMVDPKTLLWTSEPTYDGFSGIVAIFDMTGDACIWACKIWSESVAQETGDTDNGSISMRLVVYQPRQISYWFGQSGAKEIQPDNRIISEELPEGVSIKSNILPWKPGVIPLIHFANRFSNFNFSGRSEIRPAIPLQDVLNRTLHSMVMASEFSAFLVKWSKGMEIDAAGITPGAVINLLLKDTTGKIITEMSPELVEFLKAVEVGQFEATDINQYITQIDKLAREVSQIAQTPIYGVTTEGVLSGEALRQLEVGLIGKCVRFQKENTDAIRKLIELTALIQNSFVTGIGEPAPTSFKSIAPAWRNPELLDANAQITVLITMRKDSPGLWTDDFYRGRIGALMGMRQADIEAEGVKAKQEQQNTIDSLIGAGGQTTPVVA